ncbi:MAG: VPS10 domain-containing protein [Gammaproteobacteria bacterium]
MLRIVSLFSYVVLTGLLLVAPLSGSAQPVQDLSPLYAQLNWRQVGPFRAGWSTMAVGIPSQPNTFYFGGADGGVWKTSDAGLTWQPQFQQQNSISIGALAIAPSNPDIIYIGTGQVAARYDIVGGDGMYRSADAGKTWTHIGLDDSRHIGRIWIDPKDPDTVVVAAVGHFFGPNDQRGVFRTTDGGKHWQKVLFTNAETGAVDLVADDAHPQVMFAAMWQQRMHPWLDYFEPQAGPGSGIWKSSDEGKTWTRLSGHGLPTGILGRIGLAVAPGSSGRIVYATISVASGKLGVDNISIGGGSGLYRSSDGGATWQFVNHSGELASSYFGRLTVAPSDPDTVYVMGRSVQKSTDGGKTFTWFKGAPGGDDYHFMWINPDNDHYMMLASDQGSTVSVDGGHTWSSWYNQPTGQFYHVVTDNQFPYRIYSGQQDSGTVETASRSDFGEITERDWAPVGGDERSYVIPDSGDPNIVYVGGLGGHVSRYNSLTHQVQNISAWPISSYGQRPTTVRYRYTWFYPLVAAPHKAHTLYLASQVLFKTTDEGMKWSTISPDLTGINPAAAKNCNSNDINDAEAKACGYGVIFSIAPSPLKGDEIWIGTDDGLIQLTRDGGKHWQNVTPKGLPLWGRVNQIDASSIDPATAYAAVDTHRKGEPGVYIYRTHDYGRSWTLINSGIAKDQHAYVVRQDLKDPKLLYAGTNAGVYVSFNDGDRWQPLQLNLPTARVRDLTLHDDDLIVATQGRAIWVLDDVTPLRQATEKVLDASAHLFAPATAIRVRNDVNKDTPLPPEIPAGQNPPAGAVIDYWLGSHVSGPVQLAIYDDKGGLVREYASNTAAAKLSAQQYFPSGWLSAPEQLDAAAGAHRFVWDLRYPRPHALQYDYSISAIFARGTPMVPEGPLVLPGHYTVKLSAGGQTWSQPLTVKLDPRERVANSELVKQQDLAFRIGKVLDATARTHDAADALHLKLKALMPKLAGKPALLKQAQDLDQRVVALQATAKEPLNLAAVNAELASLAAEVNDGDRAPPAQYFDAYKLYAGYADSDLSAWRSVQGTALPALNAELKQQGIPAVR